MLENSVFEMMFNLIPLGIYVMDVESFEVVYANEAFKTEKGELPGVKCWETVYGNNKKCVFCKVRDLLDREGNPNGKIIIYENFDEVNDRWYQMQEQAINWPDGRIVKYGIAVEISNVKEMQNRLAEANAELSLAHSALEKVAITDRLTGLVNRLKLDETFAFEKARADRYGKPLAVIIMDIDKFKSVNDAFGHQTGDSVLKEFAGILTRIARSTDIVGRWGGEEFMIICPETDLDAAICLAERMRAQVAAHEFRSVGSRTSSFGVAAFRKGDKEADIVKRADDALYRAKQGGRNLVEPEDSGQ